MNGYIKLHRSIMDNPLWDDKPFSKGQAFIDLCMLANWGDSKVLDGNEVVTLHRGELVCSQIYLADRWGWSRKKVKGFLSVLVRERMVSVKGTTKGTTVTIENYGKYQDEGTTEDTTKEQRRNIKRTAKEHTIRRINKNKEEKEEEREYRESIMQTAHDQFVSIKQALMEGTI